MHFFFYIGNPPNYKVLEVSSMSKKKEPMFESGELVDDLFKGLYGLNPEESLLSVNFATAENPYLNEHYGEDPKDQDE